MKIRSFIALCAAVMLAPVFTLAVSAAPETDKASCSKPACCEKKEACCDTKAACCQSADQACCAKSTDAKDCDKAKSCCQDASMTAEPKPAGVPADYPLSTCVVSGEKLGSMGEPYPYTYKQEGKPDRTVYFCCKMCVKSFEKNPAKYLGKLDEAKK